ncbi:YybH family protein [Ruegeria arenilitoris]|uniref:YybH family protein n=1 Tax=Ruegeria arenilitoris TaxID=1173585 RepID=UPI00147BF26A|nr:DUF4440 domain-containing protein [Ruegeria arenilitoris]
MDMKKTLEDFDAAYNEAFNRGDAEGCAAFFTEDIMLLPPGEPMTRGKAAFLATYRSRIKENTGGTHKNELIDFGVSGDTAYQVGTYAIEDSDPPEQGKFVNILQRQPDGTWKVKISIFNSDLP